MTDARVILHDEDIEPIMDESSCLVVVFVSETKDSADQSTE